MAKKQFCSACGRNLLTDGGDPNCVACRPKETRHKFVILTHHVGGRARWRSATLRSVAQWAVCEIERETPTLIHVKEGGRYDRSHQQTCAPLRFATREEADALLAEAQAATETACKTYAEAQRKTTEAQEAERAAREVMQQASHAFFSAHAPKVAT